jgi:hypothetical protein
LGVAGSASDSMLSAVGGGASASSSVVSMSTPFIAIGASKSLSSESVSDMVGKE